MLASVHVDRDDAAHLKRSGMPASGSVATGFAAGPGPSPSPLAASELCKRFP
jgi:hypothetical protein